MAEGLTQSADANRPEVWAKDTYIDAMDNLYFMKNGMMGDGPNNIFQKRPELRKAKGDNANITLVRKLAGFGVPGDNELEGHEEIQVDDSDDIAIDQIRNGVRIKGKFVEKVTQYNMREKAKGGLQSWLTEFIEMQFFLKAGGVNNITLTDIDGNVVGTRALWSNTAAYVPDADTAAGKGARYLCADYTSGATSIAATDKMSPALLDRLKAKAKQATPKIIPLDVAGKRYFVVFLHPRQMFDLRRNAEWSQAQREAQARGRDNPIFTGADGIWNGMIVHEHEYVPYLDIDVALHSFRGPAVGTDFGTVDVYRAILCGRQAVAYIDCPNEKTWVEETFDYKNKAGFEIGIVGGIQKVTFDSKDYGVVVLDTAATAI